MSAEEVRGESPERAETALTPAASEALDLNADLFKRQVLLELSRKPTGHRARVSDVQQAVDRVAGDGKRYANMASLLARFAVLLSAGTLAFQILIQAKLSERDWAVGLAAVLVGISTGTTIVMLIQEGRRRSRERRVSAGGFLREIQTLEWSARRIAVLALGENSEAASLRRIISVLEMLDVWTPEDSQIFRRLLSIRNKIVHEYSGSLSPAETTFGLSQAARLSKLIRARERELAHSSERISVWSHRSPRRAALSYEERVASALRRASFDVMGAQGEHDYDLLAETPRGTVAIIIKYRSGDCLEIGDIFLAAKKGPHGLPLIIITNAQLSAAAVDYLASPDVTSALVRVISWSEDEPDDVLVERVLRAADVPSAAG
jgi:hypothetical protein